MNWICTLLVEPSITDWVSALSSFGATFIAGITAWYAYKQYLQPPVQEVEPSAAQDVEDDAELTKVIVFRTSKQKTYLEITERGLECHLDDSRPNKGGHQWTLSKTQIQEILKNSDYSVSPGAKARTGLFSIGQRKNWLYSKALFPEPEYLHGTLTEVFKKLL